MKRKTFNTKAFYTSLTAAVLLLSPVAAQAYVGPGAGLTAIGTMIALVAALLLAIVGFVWYPVKRMLKARKAKSQPVAAPENQR
ncbi:MAG: hypothetical protein AAF729_07980 [Pseudomonadota bacterium]